MKDLLKVISVPEEKKKTSWWVSEVELDDMEKIIFRTMLTRAVGVKRLEELKDMGDIKAVKGGICVELNIGRNKKLSMFFGRKYNAYEYRSEIFYEAENYDYDDVEECFE